MSLGTEQKRVIALVRVSSEEQASEGLGGLQRQWRDIDAVCKRENLAVVQKFSLEGISGSTVKLNPQFKKMLSAVAKPGIAGLVISSPDRLMRCADLADLAVLEPFGKEETPRLIWTSESTYNLRKFDSQLMFLVQTLSGGHEKKQILKRTQDGINLSRERGDKCADKPPRGCEFVITDPKNRTGFYRYNKDAQQVRRAFEKVLQRDSSIKAIAKELGFGTYQGLRKTLSNPVWIGIRSSKEKREKLPHGPNGELRYKRVPRLNPIEVPMVLAPGTEPLISRETFDAVQAILAGINKEYVTRRVGHTKFELNGILRCQCGARRYGKHDKRKGKSGYYICKTRFVNAHAGCGTPNLSRLKADSAVMARLTEILSSKETLTKLLTDALTPTDASDMKAERTELQAKVDSLIAKRTRLIDRISDGVLSEAEARISMSKIRSDLDAATARLSEIERKLSSSKVGDVEKIVKVVIGLFRKAQFKSSDARRELIKQVVESVTVDTDYQVVALRLRLSLDAPVTFEMKEAS